MWVNTAVLNKQFNTNKQNMSEQMSESANCFLFDEEVDTTSDDDNTTEVMLGKRCDDYNDDDDDECDDDDCEHTYKIDEDPC